MNITEKAQNTLQEYEEIKKVNSVEMPPRQKLSSLETTIVQQELKQELTSLNAKLKNNPENFSEFFKERCKTRYQINYNTCLSIQAYPDIPINCISSLLSYCLSRSTALSPNH